MPPPARVCMGCKQSKTSCIGFSPTTKCKRCERLGLNCIPAPQRSMDATRKLMKPATKKLLVGNESGDASGSIIPSNYGVAGVSTWGGPQVPQVLIPTQPQHVTAPTSLGLDQILSSHQLPGESCIMNTVIAQIQESPDGQNQRRTAVLRRLLRSWALIARQRNAYTLMAYVLFLCQKFNIAMDDVMGSSFFAAPPGAHGSVQTPWALPNSNSQLELEHSTPFMLTDATARGVVYQLTRTSCDGKMTFATNEAFERCICTVAEMKACWERNVSEVRSLFVHPDDGTVLETAVGQLFSQLTDDGIARRIRAQDTMRLYERSLCRYVRCELHASMSIRNDGRTEQIIFEWMLLPEPALDMVASAAQSNPIPEALTSAVLNVANAPHDRVLEELEQLLGPLVTEQVDSRSPSSDSAHSAVDNALAELHTSPCL